ncbi:MAG: carbohydrate kinase [Phycisphaerae bacterium]
MSSATVIGLGEVLWDNLPDGRRLGGAPANVAYHATQFGCRGVVASAVGRDEPGQDLLHRLNELGLDTSLVQKLHDRPTSTVDVELDDSGSPSYVIHEHVAWDKLAETPALLSAVRSADALVFGSLAQRSEGSRRTIHAALSNAPPGCLKLFDVNLRPPFVSAEVIAASVKRCDVLKLNKDELPFVARMLNLPTDRRGFCTEAVKSLGVKLVAVTGGSAAGTLYDGTDFSDRDPDPVQIVDTVGAGDSFTASIVTGMLAGQSLEAIHERAGKVAAFVCTQSGGTPKLPEALTRW